MSEFEDLVRRTVAEELSRLDIESRLKEVEDKLSSIKAAFSSPQPSPKKRESKPWTGSRIRNLRKKRGESVVQFAETVGAPPSSIQYWEGRGDEEIHFKNYPEVPGALKSL